MLMSDFETWTLRLCCSQDHHSQGFKRWISNSDFSILRKELKRPSGLQCWSTFMQIGSLRLRAVLVAPLSHTLAHSLSPLFLTGPDPLSLAHTCSNKGRHTLPPSSHTPKHSPLSHAHTYSLTSTCPLSFTHTLSIRDTFSILSYMSALTQAHTLLISSTNTHTHTHILIFV